MRFGGLGGFEWVIMLCICFGPVILLIRLPIFISRRSKSKPEED